MPSPVRLASRLLVGLALCLFAASAARAQGIGVAQDFNVFVFGDLTRSGVDATGRVAAGGNVSLTNYGVGVALANSNGTRDDLVAGGALTFTSGAVYSGNARSGGTYTPAHLQYGAGNAYIAGNPIDFAAAEASLNALSTAIAAQPATGTTTYQWGGIFLTGANAALNVFSVDATQLANANQLQINAPAGSTVHINVTGAASARMRYFQFFLTGVDKQRVLMNFVDATSLEITGITPYASILAPKAAVNFHNGGHDGQLIAKTLLPGNGESHHFPYLGTLPAAPSPMVDLSLTKTVDTATATVGDVVTYTVTAANAGPADATGVVVTDLLPASLAFVAATPSQGTYDSATGAWTVGGIASGASRTLSIQARVTAAGSIVNTAEVTAASPADVDSTPNNHVASEDDQASVTVTASNPIPTTVDLSLTKTVSAATAIVGDVVTYTVAVSNAGPAVATGVAVTDVLPAGLTFVSASATQGTYASGTGVWTVGSVAVSGTQTLTIQARVTAAGAIVNTAEVTASDKTDVDSTPNNQVASEDDQASATVTASNSAPTPTIDLALAKTVNTPAPTLGDVVTFTVTVRNTGTADATGVVVSDALPAGLSFVAATASQGAYDAATGLWTVGAVATGTAHTLAIQTRVTATGSVENVAEVVAADQTDIDSTPNNHLDSEDDQASAAVTTGSPSGGGGAGVESEGTMATLMARRLYQRREDVAARATLLAAPTPVLFADALGHASADGPRLNVSGTAGVSLRAVVPAAGPLGTVAYDVTPGDLLGVTNATSVVAADFVRPDGRRLAAMFGATSPGGVLYDHAKATCDRFGGGRLDAVRRLDVAGRAFVLSKLVHVDGAVDYSVSFVAYRSGTTYTVESQFAPERYRAPAGTDEVVNLQVWSASESLTADLVQRVLDRLAAQGRVVFGTTTAALPRAFVVDGRYEGGALVLRLKNHTMAPLTVDVTGAVAATEADAMAGRRTAFTRTVTIPAPTATAPFASVRVDVGAIFDGTLVVDPAASHDQVYLADGTWSSYAPAGGATIRTMTTTAETRPATAGTLLVERAASMAGDVRDYATLFRYLRPAGAPVDLRGYDAIEFEVRGTGAAQLLVEKSSVATWADKFIAPLTLTSTWKAVRVPLASLVRAGGTAGTFTGEDVTMLAFYALGNRSASQPFALDVRNLRFTTGTTTDAEAAPALGDGVALAAPAPNPFGGAGTTVRFSIPSTMPVRVDVYDVLGRRVATLVDETLTGGSHEARLDGGDLPSGTYLVRLTTAETTVTRPIVRVR